jgi:excisionase family DNA binding protein
MSDSTDCHKADSAPINTQAIWQRHRENGEPLILAIHAEGLRGFHRATVLRWVLSGKIPALKIGRRFLTTQSLVDEWVGGGKAGGQSKACIVPEKAKPGPKSTKANLNDHAAAVARLEARFKGNKPAAKKSGDAC